MGASAGAIGSGAVIAVIGGFILLFGIGMALSGPFVTTSFQQNNGFLGIGGGQSASGSVNLVPVIGVVVLVIGAIVLLVGMKGVMHSFESGKERDEGTRHHLTVKKE